MTYHVHAVEQDLAGSWYARVVISDTEATFLKFQEFPTMAAIQEAAAAFVEANRPELLPEAAPVLERARDDEGRFIADDPATPEDEAWVEVSDATAQ